MRCFQDSSEFVLITEGMPLICKELQIVAAIFLLCFRYPSTCTVTAVPLFG